MLSEGLRGVNGKSVPLAHLGKCPFHFFTLEKEILCTPKMNTRQQIENKILNLCFYSITVALQMHQTVLVP